MPPGEPSPEQLEKQVRALGPWFHNLELGGVQTAPEHFLGDFPRNFFTHFQDALPRDLTGKSVLDIGCNAGFYCFEMKRRGAARVVGIEHDPHYLAQARFAARVTGLDVELRALDVYDVAQLRERFDVVLFMGVLYHLRHPLLALDLLHEHVVGDQLVFQTMQRGSDRVEALAEDYSFEESALFDRPGFPRLGFIERKYAGDPTNWWVPNRACTEAMLRAAGFAIEQLHAREVYLCRRAARPRFAGPALGVTRVHPKEERASGEGRT
jgi:tRNA (mo5U34)-methyltransferase